jgi:hypothetical protein
VLPQHSSAIDLKQLVGRWIWPDRLMLIPRNQYALFRRAISLTTRPREARLRITADARYRLFVNGEPVHFGPARCFPDQQCVDELDIAEYLNEGENVIAVIAHQFGIGTFQSVWREASGLLIDGIIETDGDKPVELHTPGEWLCKTSSAWKRDVARSAIQMGFQEHFDGEAEPPTWMLPGFNASEQDGWRKPFDCGPAGVHPWTTLVPRQVPLLATSVHAFSRVVGVFRGANTRGHKVATDVYKLVEGEKVKKDSDGLDGSAAMLVEDDAVTIIPPPEVGTFVAVVLETRGYCTGHFILDIADAAGGEIVDIVYNEAINKDGWLHFNSIIGGGAQTASRYRCRAGAQQWESFHFNGMRYVAVVFRNVERPLKVRFIGARRTHADVELAGSFECSDSKLNSIWQMCRETQLACLLDTFVDCPWREQAMWWGDARVQAAVTAHAFGDTSILEYGIRLIAKSQTADGSFHAHPPSDWPGHRLPDFMCNWVSSLWDHYWLTGRIDLIRDCLPAAHRLFEFFERHARPDGLIGGFDGWWVFLDWAELHKSDYSATLNLFYLQALEHATRICTLAGDPPAAQRYKATAEHVRQAIIDCLWDDKANVFRDGLDANIGKPVDKISQQANALAVLLKLNPAEATKTVREALLKPAMKTKSSVVTSTPFFYSYVFESLVQEGLRDEAINIIADKWGDWVDTGRVTCSETWKPIPLSHCHAWSASPLYVLMQELLGVRATEAGFRRLRIAPLPHGLDFARGVVPTPLGLVKVEWESVSGDQLAVRIDLPPAIEAEFVSPAGQTLALKSGKNEFQT